MRSGLRRLVLMWGLLTAFGTQSLTAEQFGDNGDGTVTDTKTGLVWAAKDVGEELNWEEAMEYCRNCRGSGHSDWRMPTLRELGALCDPGISGLTPLITLTACCVRSSDSAGQDYDFHTRTWGPPQAYTWNFADNNGGQAERDSHYRLRALPVRLRH